ncbi:ABC transporter permease [Paenibacillus paeoniae]|uniref:ABC transporter permease n=1 Tax=Paenibacillus paeoniae TaxID=2292705 RepID=A0A371PN69_9BACL|nr:ABC transporter permease [Paenibacillus paeoniae]REK77628.1 ABC transporter permease [Paenibacillus paeoniae]
MIKLIVFEFQKHFLKPSIIVAVLLFSLLSIAKIHSIQNTNSLFSGSNTSPAWKGLYWNLYEEFGGAITNEKIEKLMAIYRPLEYQTADRTASSDHNPDSYTGGNIYMDRNFFMWNYVNPMKYAYEYKMYANQVVSAAERNMDFFESIGNTFEYKKNAVIKELFQERSISIFSYKEMYHYYVQYDFSAFLVLLICLYSLMHVFISEKETDMEMLLLTTKSGNNKTIFAKLMASAIFVCMLCSWFWTVDFVAFSLLFGSFESASTPLYALEDFVNSSIGVSLSQYAIISGLIKTFGIFVLSLLFLVVSCFFKNALVPFIISLSIMISLIFMNEVYMGSGRTLQKIINPFVLIVNRELFRKTEFVDSFGYPMLHYMAAILLAVVWGLLLTLGITVFVKKNTLRKGVKRHAIMDL